MACFRGEGAVFCAGHAGRHRSSATTPRCFVFVRAHRAGGYFFVYPGQGLLNFARSIGEVFASRSEAAPARPCALATRARLFQLNYPLVFSLDAAPSRSLPFYAAIDILFLRTFSAATRCYAINRYRRCLDLGCGTGLSGHAASSVCGNLVGVDLSPAMVDRAKEKRLYRRLLVGDVTETVERLCRESSGTPATDGAGTISRPGGWEAPVGPEEEGGAAAPAAVTTAATSTAVAAATVAGGGEGEASPMVRSAAVAAAAGGGGHETKPALEEEGVAAPPLCDLRSSNGRIVDTNCTPGEEKKERGELIISCDVFGYIGDLRPCFKAVHELVTGDGSWMAEPQEPGAIFAFSAEAPPATNTAKTTSKSGSGADGRDSHGGSQRPGYELQGTGR